MSHCVYCEGGDPVAYHRAEADRIRDEIKSWDGPHDGIVATVLRNRLAQELAVTGDGE